MAFGDVSFQTSLKPETSSDAANKKIIEAEASNHASMNLIRDD